MKLTRCQSITGPSPNAKSYLSKVTSLCYSPDNTRLAVATSDRVVSIYNNQGELVDKFNTKANNNGPKDYIIRSIQFGPEINSPKLAIAQSDAIVFVYKWKQTVDGTNQNHGRGGRRYEHGNSTVKSQWDGKKSISNKFPEESAVTSLIWPKKHPFQLVYGLVEGKVKIGNVKTNKSKTLYKVDSNIVVALAISPNGAELLSGHLDGSIYRFTFPTKTRGSSCVKIIDGSFTPYVLSWARSICVAGLENKVIFYDNDGNEEQSFFYDNQSENSIDTNGSVIGDVTSREFVTSSCSPNGESVVIGSFNCFYLFCWNTQKSLWEENTVYIVQNMYSVSAIDWKPNGSSLVMGTSSGLVDEYDIAYRELVYKDTFTITYVSPYQVLIREKEGMNTSPVLIQSERGEIIKVKIYHEPNTSVYRYIIARTKKSLLFCDMESPNKSLSEISWQYDEKVKERFMFDASNACIICNAGELTIVEYGQDNILGSVRTEFVSAHLLSLRVNEYVHSTDNQQGSCKVIAYLLDQQTICIKDLITTNSLTVNHKVAIDFIEMNTKGSFVVFRDKKRNLYVYDIMSQTKTIVLSYCGYVQWVPSSDVLVAQSRSKMCIWYNITAINQITTLNINGEIEGIERIEGRTDVLVDEGGTIVAYSLSEELICFTSALQEADLKECVTILENIGESPQSLVMWQELHANSLKRWDLPIAERCAVALGNVSQARYLRKTLKIARMSNFNGEIHNYWEVRAKMLQLNNEFAEAERIYLSHNRVDDAISMYENLMLFSDALRVAETANIPELKSKKESYFQWFLDNDQQDKAAHMREIDGDCAHAISIYLDAGFSGKAAQIIADRDILQPRDLLENVAQSLIDAQLFKESGEIYERIGQVQKALTQYTKGFAFKEALRLAESSIPSKVVAIEEMWGDHLVSSGQDAFAVEHFVEAHALVKAVDAAINAKMMNRASDIAKQINVSPSPYLEKIAVKFAAAKKFEDAERLFIMAEMNRDAISMYLNNGMLEKASKIASELLSKNDIEDFFTVEATHMVEKREFDKAEKLYLFLNKPEAAVVMWKTNGRYDRALKLANSHCPHLYDEVNTYAAVENEKAGRFSDAESFYTSSGDWLEAVNMYRKRDMWDEAIRVARSSQDDNILNRVAYAYSIHLGDGAHKELSNLKLLKSAISFALHNGAVEKAFDLARGDSQSQEILADIHLNLAQSLEGAGKYNQAEEEYIKAGGVSNAIDMYLHLDAWDDAERIAKLHDPPRLNHIYLAHADSASKNEDYITAERLYTYIGKPERALDMYKKDRLWQDALRIAEEHLPHLSNEMQTLLQESIIHKQIEMTSKAQLMREARTLEKAHKFDEAIDVYLHCQSHGLSDSDLEELWDNAISLVNAKRPERISDVSKEVSSRLCEVGLFSKAAEVLFQSNQVDSAVRILVQVKNWEQAKIYAQGHPRLVKICNDAHNQWLVQNRDPHQLLVLGETKAAFDVMMDEGDWDSIWETLRCQKELDPSSFVKYSEIRMKELLEDGGLSNISHILSMISEKMAPPPDYNLHFDLYLTIVQQVLGINKNDEESSDYCTILKNLRDVLLLVIEKCKSHQNRNVEATASFTHLIMAVHYSYMMHLCVAGGLSVMACKCSITLLRYAVLESNDGTTFHTLIPSDKLFYTAGALCKKTNHNQLSFVLKNRYVDIVEAMEDSDLKDFSHGEFSSTNVVYDANLPIHHYIPNEETREEVKDWVLAACIDSAIERTLPMPSVVEGDLHEGLYESNRDQCIVTGYPIPEGKSFQVDKYKANKDDWDCFFNEINTYPWQP